MPAPSPEFQFRLVRADNGVALSTHPTLRLALMADQRLQKDVKNPMKGGGTGAYLPTRIERVDGAPIPADVLETAVYAIYAEALGGA